jgi:hypothetical protein
MLRSSPAPASRPFPVQQTPRFPSPSRALKITFFATLLLTLAACGGGGGSSGSFSSDKPSPTPPNADDTPSAARPDLRSR